MKSLSRNTIQYLKGCAHSMKPVVLIGKNGLSAGVIGAIDDVLNSHELIKIKFIDCKDEKKDLSSAIVKQTKSIMVGLVGNVLIVYRPHAEEDKRQYERAVAG